MSVGRAGSDLHVARVLRGDKAEFDEMVESAAVVRAHLPAYGPTLSRQMRSEVGLILPPQTWQGEDMRAVMAIAM